MIKSLPKPKRERSESRLAWCRKLNCALLGLKWYEDGKEDWHVCIGPIDAHHVDARGAGGSDFSTLPLCRFAHDKYHRIGRTRFAALYQLNLSELIRVYNARYNREHPQRPQKVREPRVQLCVKCSCKGIHPVRGGRYYCTRTRKYQEVA